MKKLLALLLALVLMSQLVTPVLAETLPEETTAPTAELEEPTQVPETEPPVPATLAPTEPATEAPTTAATETLETTLSTEPPAVTEVPEVTDPTGETEATEPTGETEATESTEATDPTEETAETDLALLAEDDILASGNCGAEADGSNVTWVLTTDGTMILSGTGAVAAYDDRDRPWYDYRYQILRLEVKKGITSVGGFRYCFALQEVSLPEGLISLDEFAFMDCQKLQEIRLPKSLKTLGRGTFAGCHALPEIELPEDLETVGEGALMNCLSLTSVVIPASVTEMGDRPFSGDWALKTVEIKGNVPRLSSSSFSECDALQEVLITGSVGTIGDYAFMDLGSLERVQIASGLKTIGKLAFWSCDKLTTVSLPDGVTTIGKEAFKDCVSLTTVNLPNSITTIGANAFNGTKLTGPLNIPSSLVSLGDNAFNGCSGITGTLVFPAAMENISTNVFAGCSGIEEIVLPRGVLTIGAGAFNNCSGVQRLWLTNSIQSIGANAFNGMKNLKKVYFSGTILEWETGIQWADKGYQIGVAITTNEETASGSCGEALTWSLNSAGDLTVSGTGDMASFTATGAPWAEYRDQVKLVIVGQGVTSIGSSAFQDCKNLKTVSLPGSLTAIGKNAFLRCGELTNVKLPASLKSVGEDCFTDCEKLVLLDLTGVPDEIMELRTSLEGTVTLPAGVKNARLRWKLETAAGEIPCSEIAEVCGQEGGYYLKMKSSGKVRLTCRDAMTGAQGSKTVTFTEGLMILPQGVDTLISGEKLALSAVAMPGAKQITARWFLVSGQEYATVTEKGVLTAGIVEEPTTIQVTAVLTGSTVRMTKQFTILPQVSQVTIQYRGNPAPAEQNVSAEDGDTLRFKASTLPAEAVSPVQWRSSDEKVAVVDGGLVTLVGSGRAVITAQAMDGGKKEASVTLNVTYRDRTPRLVSTTVSLNGASTQGAELELVESGSAIASVQLDDAQFTASYENGTLTIAPAKFVPKGTYPVNLTVSCENGKTYDYDLTVKVTVALPKLTVKQDGKFNLFYDQYYRSNRSSSAALIISGGQVEDVVLDSTDFSLIQYDDSRYLLDYKRAGISEKPNTKATLSVLFKGYNTPVTKTVTIATENKAPKLTLNPTASVVNTELSGTALYARAQLPGDFTSFVKVTWDDNPNVEKVELSSNTVTIALKEGAKSTTVNFYIQDYTWRHPVKLTHKITVTDKAPTVKLSSTKLTLNRFFPAVAAPTDITLSQENLKVTGVRFENVPDELSLRYEQPASRILAYSKDAKTMPKNGKYTITYYAQLAADSGKTYEIPGKLTVQVEDKLPTVKLSASTVKLNRSLAGKETATVKIIVSDPEHYSFIYFDKLPKGVEHDWHTNELVVTLTENTINGGTFQLEGMVLRMRGYYGYHSTVLDKNLTLKIQTYDKEPSFKLSAKGKLDVLNPASEIVYTPKMTNCLNAPTAVELTGDDAGLFKASLDSEGKIHLTLAKSGKHYSTKTAYKVTPVLTACGQKINGAALSVKVTQSAFKLAKLPNRTVFTTQTTALMQQLVVAGPAGAKIGDVTLNAKTTAALREAVETAGGIGFDAQSGMITVPSEAFTNLKPGRYTLILDVTPANTDPDTKPTQAKLTLTVRK